MGRHIRHPHVERDRPRKTLRIVPEYSQPFDRKLLDFNGDVPGDMRCEFRGKSIFCEALEALRHERVNETVRICTHPTPDERKAREGQINDSP